LSGTRRTSHRTACRRRRSPDTGTARESRTSSRRTRTCGMRAATLTRPHRRTSAWTACGRHSGTRTLEDRLATLRHDGTRRRCRTCRRQIDRTRSGLRHNQPAGRCGGLRRTHARLPRRCCRSSGTRLTDRPGVGGFNLGDGFGGESFGCNGSLGFVENCYLILDGGLD